MQKIRDAYMTTAALIMPVSYERNHEDGFMYERPRPQHKVVLVTLPDGSRYDKDGGQDLLDAVKAAGEIDLSDGWQRYEYSEYGSPAWEEEVWMMERNTRW